MQFISKTYKEMVQWVTSINNKKTFSNKTSEQNSVVGVEPIKAESLSEFEIYENPDEIVESTDAPILPPRNPNLNDKFRKLSYNNTNQYNNITKIQEVEQVVYEEEQVIYDELLEQKVEEDIKTPPKNPLLSAASKYDMNINIQKHEIEEEEEEDFYDEILEYKPKEEEKQNEPPIVTENKNSPIKEIIEEEYEEPVFNRSSQNIEDNHEEVTYDDLSEPVQEPPVINNQTSQPEEEDLIYDDLCDMNFNNEETVKNKQNSIEELPEYDEMSDVNRTIELFSPEKPPTKPKPVISPKPKINSKFAEKFSKKLFNETDEQNNTDNTSSPRKLKQTIIQKMERSLSFTNRKLTN